MGIRFHRRVGRSTSVSFGPGTLLLGAGLLLFCAYAGVRRVAETSLWDAIKGGLFTVGFFAAIGAAIYWGSRWLAHRSQKGPRDLP